MMKFDDLDKQLRVFETADDYCVLPGVYMVARIDGRSFTKLTKEVHNFDAPFDVRFRDMMVSTTEHLMKSGFKVVYGYTQSDEISLVFHREENSFSRKTRKFNSVLAGEASGKFSLLLDDHAAFGCRISQLPSKENVVNYLRWRQEDAHRNALNAHSYWALRYSGKNASEATEYLSNFSTSQKNELLFKNFSINFNDLPNWHKRGVGLYWESFQKEAINPLTQESVQASRKRIHIDYDLPMKDEYDTFIRELIEE